MHVIEPCCRHEVPVHGELAEVVGGSKYVVELDSAVQSCTAALQGVVCHVLLVVPHVHVPVKHQKDVDKPAYAYPVHPGPSREGTSRSCGRTRVLAGKMMMLYTTLVIHDGERPVLLENVMHGNQCD